MGQLGAVPGADETETEHWWLQLQRGGNVGYFYLLTELNFQVFQRIDDDLRLIMGDAVKDPRVIAILRCFNLLPNCNLPSIFYHQGGEHKKYADIYA